jgi:tetratricopeptide (TPR) repeat protein
MGAKIWYNMCQMRGLVSIVAVCALCFGAQGAWYWPFSSDEEEKDQPRLSELIEPASLLIDDAMDLLHDGKQDEAVEKFREALEALEKLEAENPERAATDEFTTVRTKRAYVNAAIDSILLDQARKNAKAVAVTDTTELEKKMAAKTGDGARAPDPLCSGAAERPAAERGTPDGDARPKVESKLDEYVEKDKARTKVTQKTAAKVKAKKAVDKEIKKLLEADPKSRRGRLLQAGEDIRLGDYAAAKLTIAELLDEKPNDASALNMRAMCEAAMGDEKAAEATLDQAINSNPRNHYAYYNMANLMLAKGRKSVAKKYYETGREVGGEKDEKLEEALK